MGDGGYSVWFTPWTIASEPRSCDRRLDRPRFASFEVKMTKVIFSDDGGQWKADEVYTHWSLNIGSARKRMTRQVLV